MSPTRRKATSTRHAKAKRAARRSGRRARARRAAKGGGAARGVELRAAGLARGVGSAATKRSPKRGRLDPKLAVVARPAPRKPKRAPRARPPSVVSEFAGARAGASAKDLALFGLERARVAVHAAIQGMSAGAAERPVAPEKWTVRQMVLHVAFWDREIMQKYLEAAAALNRRADIRRSRLDAMNAAGVAGLAHHDWEAAKRLLQSTHEALWDALDSIPAEPEDVWSREHAVGELVHEVTRHDRHHADVIKRWRAEAGA